MITRISKRLLKIAEVLQYDDVSPEEKDLLTRLRKIILERKKIRDKVKKQEERIGMSNSVMQKERLDNELKQMKRTQEKFDEEYELIKGRLLDMDHLAMDKLLNLDIY